MRREIPLSAIRDVAVFFPGDLHDLGVFLLKAWDARDREANARHRGYQGQRVSVSAACWANAGS